PGVVPGEQRSVAHTVLPSLSIATPFEPPHGRFSPVNCAQSRTTRYGLVPLFTGCTLSVCGVPPRCCARTTPACSAIDAMITATVNALRRTPETDMVILPSLAGEAI